MTLEDLILLAVALNLLVSIMVLLRLGRINKDLVKLRRKHLSHKSETKKRGRPRRSLTL